METASKDGTLRWFVRESTAQDGCDSLMSLVDLVAINKMPNVADLVHKKCIFDPTFEASCSRPKRRPVMAEH